MWVWSCLCCDLPPNQLFYPSAECSPVTVTQCSYTAPSLFILFFFCRSSLININCCGSTSLCDLSLLITVCPSLSPDLPLQLWQTLFFSPSGKQPDGAVENNQNKGTVRDVARALFLFLFLRDEVFWAYRPLRMFKDDHLNFIIYILFPNKVQNPWIQFEFVYKMPHDRVLKKRRFTGPEGN